MFGISMSMELMEGTLLKMASEARNMVCCVQEKGWRTLIEVPWEERGG